MESATETTTEIPPVITTPVYDTSAKDRKIIHVLLILVIAAAAAYVLYRASQSASE
jgi:hypothetical protein